ncbi:uncharacterized protein L201_002169 [Kwoniella dendrophila CBS 6074]|uniref:Exoribonuclease phosphorolytic domain-containing protein n=1 Tax=Kwoniella dendrophila CBS 6074 TaxID=1295534 RepID=A0AAX4JPG4_9TREE
MSNAGPSRRYDGRKPHEMRPLQIEIGELDRADGSGRFGFGSTAALASCSGPLEVRLNKELPTKATLEISHRPLQGVGATPSRALITTLESIFPSSLSLNSHPRSLIQIIVQSLSSSNTSFNGNTSNSHGYGNESIPSIYIDTNPDDVENVEKNVWPQSQSQLQSQSDVNSGRENEIFSPSTSYTYSSRAASINATTLSTLDSGSIAILNIPIAISISNIIVNNGEKNTQLIIDPTNEEESKSKARFGFAWSFGKNISLNQQHQQQQQQEDVKMEVDNQQQEQEDQEMELVWVESEGKFNKETFSDALELSKIACKQILDEIRTRLGEKIESRRLL